MNKKATEDALPQDIIDAANKNRPLNEDVSRRQRELLTVEVFCPVHYRWEAANNCVNVRFISINNPDYVKETK